MIHSTLSKAPRIAIVAAQLARVSFEITRKPTLRTRVFFPCMNLTDGERTLVRKTLQLHVPAVFAGKDRTTVVIFERSASSTATPSQVLDEFLQVVARITGTTASADHPGLSEVSQLKPSKTWLNAQSLRMADLIAKHPASFGL